MDLGDVPDRWQAWWDTNQVTCIKYSRIEKTLEEKYDPEHVNLLERVYLNRMISTLQLTRWAWLR
jgi:hypothetical protein